ncbi:MAG TPA: hypothetical protein DD789_03075 [Firmicutes bacterium]|nr:hypothetical protein [Bacillota bacterium]
MRAPPKYFIKRSFCALSWALGLAWCKRHFNWAGGVFLFSKFFQVAIIAEGFKIFMIIWIKSMR